MEIPMDLSFLNEQLELIYGLGKLPYFPGLQFQSCEKKVIVSK